MVGGIDDYRLVSVLLAQVVYIPDHYLSKHIPAINTVNPFYLPARLDLVFNFLNKLLNWKTYYETME